MSFIKVGDAQPIVDHFEQPNRKRTFNDDGEVVYTDLSEDATIIDLINEEQVVEEVKE